MAEETKPALLLEFTGTFNVEARVDPVTFYQAMAGPYRGAYLRWDADAAEDWPDECPAWMKPYAYLVCHFIENVEVDAAVGSGFIDNTRELDDIEDEVCSRASQRGYNASARKWSEDDYRVLLAAVPWLAAADDSEVAQDIARTAPGPDDQPLFDVPDGGA